MPEYKVETHERLAGMQCTLYLSIKPEMRAPANIYTYNYRVGYRIEKLISYTYIPTLKHSLHG